MFLLHTFKKRFFFKNHDLNTIVYLLVTFFLLTLCYDYLYFSVEKMDSILTMFYYNIVTASTVGYGDFSPQTAMGKLLTAIYIPVAISLFAAFLSVIGSILYKKIHRRDQGVALISTEVDYLILGGYKDKVEELLAPLIKENKRAVLMNQLYDTLPLAYKQEGIQWIKGDGVSGNSLEMIDHSKVKHYVVLSNQPTKASSDMLSIYRVEKLLGYAEEKRITVEVVHRLGIFPSASNIRYISVVKGALLAKELLYPQFLLPLEKLLENREAANQYNLINPKTQSWQALKELFQEKKLSAIGYRHAEEHWIFSPNDQSTIDQGVKIKCIASSFNKYIPKETREQTILLVGNSRERMEQLKQEYLLDERYVNNLFKTINPKGTEVIHLVLDDIYTHVVIFADLENTQSDMTNYFFWRYFREKFPEAKIVVEFLNNQNRVELEHKYEDAQNEFVSIAQIGLMVQELQDEGMIQFVEQLSDDEVESIAEEIEKILN